MASLVVQNAGRFTAGETVSAYPESNWAPHKRPPTGAPVGAASGTGAMDANSATITGLAADTRYYVHGATSGTYVAADTTDQTSSQAVLAPHGSTHEPGGTDAMAADAAAGTASLRSLGATGNKAMPGTYLDTDTALAADSDAKVASQKATKAYVATAGGLLVPKSLVDAKGDLLVGSAADTVARHAAGSNGQLVVFDSAQTDGLRNAGPEELLFPLVSALPGSPSDGQVVRYQDATLAALGIVWVFRYRSGASGSYKWEFVGGGEWTSEVAAAESTTSTSYVNLTTTGPTITVPLAGDYILGHGAFVYNDTISASTYMSYAVGGAAALDADAVSFASAVIYQTSSLSSVRRRNGLAAATALTAKYKASAGTAFAERRFMAVRPVRVG